MASPLQREIENTMNRLAVLLHSQREGVTSYGDEHEIFEAAKGHYAEAQTLIARLLERIHG